MVCTPKLSCRDMAHQLTFGGQWSSRTASESYACCNTKNVSIDRHHIAPKSHGAHHIRRLTPHTRQTLQRIDIIGHTASEIIFEHLCRGYEMARLCIGI